jgi:hypothetical protein
MINVFRIALPLTLWLVSFSAVYALHGMICAGTWAWLADPDRRQLALISAWAVAIALQVAALLVLWHPRLGAPPGLVRWVSVALGVAALVAVVWTLFPVAALPPCTQRG